MEFHVIIPARYDSTRLPGKPLIHLKNKTMIQHVHEKAMRSGATTVVIATDDERIREVAEGFGAKVCMTSSEHQSGTERLAEAVVKLGLEDHDIVVNVQGDEPLIPSNIIYQIAENLNSHDNTKMATLCESITNPEDIFNPDIVKVVLNHRNFALYFSRAPIAWNREAFQDRESKFHMQHYYRHIGIYAYRVGFLQEYVSWEASPLEKIEQLEQLRVLWNGGKIHVGFTKETVPPSVDTPSDLEKVQTLIA